MKIRTVLLLALFTAALSAPVLAKDNKALPPGLQKKQQQGKALPPGWQKRLNKGDVLEESIFVQGKIVSPLGRDGSISIEVDGTILRLHEKTREILDILL